MKLWLEAYSGGKKIEPPLSILEYGQSIDQEVEGNIGVAIINADSSGRQFFLYGPDIRLSPHAIDEEIF